jgi:hypothetical protein
MTGKSSDPGFQVRASRNSAARPGCADRVIDGPKQADLSFADVLLGTALFLTLLAGSYEVHGVPLRLPGAWMCACLALLSLFGGRVNHGAGKFVLLVVLWLVWVCVSFLWSPSGARIGEQLPPVMLLIGLLLCSYVLVSRASPGLPRLILWLTYAAGLTYAVSGLLLGGGDAQGRLSAFGGGPNVYVRVVGAGLIAGLALGLLTNRRIVLLTLPVLGVAAILSGSRGGLVALLGGVFLVWARALSSRSPRIRRTVLASSVLGLAIGYFVAWPHIERFVQERFVQQTFESG